jgi:hypothetical protein
MPNTSRLASSKEPRMTPRWILPIVTALMLGASVSAHAATIQITMENLAISPAEASAKVGDTIEWIKGYFRPYRDGAKWRLGRDDAAEKDRHPGFEEGRHDRLLLPLPSEHEGYPRSRAMRPLERSEMGQSRHSDHAPITSGLPPKADNFRASRHFAYAPERSPYLVRSSAARLPSVCKSRIRATIRNCPVGRSLTLLVACELTQPREAVVFAL